MAPYVAEGDTEGAAVRPMETEEEAAARKMKELGYDQQLRRELNLIEIVGVSSSVMNPYITTIPFYSIALSFGGPVAVMWPWWPTMFFVLITGLCLSEICSAFPLNGSIYFWTAAMCPPRWRSLVTWMSAWLEVVKLVVGNASVAFPATQILQQIILLASGGFNGGGYFASKAVFFVMYAAIIASWAFVNCCGIKLVSKFLSFFVYYNIVLTVGICILLPAVAPTHQSADTVYLHWETSPDITGVHGIGLNWMFATLLPQFSSFGYDTAANVTEETKFPERDGPRAILAAIFIEICFGYALLTVFTFCTQGNFEDLFSTNNATGGTYPVAQILYDVFLARFNSAVGAYLLLIALFVPFYASGLAMALGASRAIYSLSRDNALPLSRLWRKVTRNSKIPAYAQCVVALIAILFGTPNFGSTVAFNAIASTTTIAWVGSYGIPIFFRLIMKESAFPHGPFYMGRLTKPFCVLSLAYIIFTCGMFMAPTTYPVKTSNLNYAPFVFLLVVVAAFLTWLIEARKWFKGPVVVPAVEVELQRPEDMQ